VQFWLILLAALLFTPDSLLALYQPGQSSDHDFTNTSKIVVKLKAEVRIASSHDRQGMAVTGLGSFDDISRQHNITSVETIQKYRVDAAMSHPLKNALVIEVPPESDFEALLADYRELEVVEYAHLDWPAELYVAPNDPLYEHQWPLHNVGQGCYHVERFSGNGNDTLAIVTGTPDADIDELEVFENPPDATTTVIVAIIDTGVDLDHPDLAAHIWTNASEIPDNDLDDDHNGYVDDYYGWDFCGDVTQLPPTPDHDPTDAYGHGTHCAGTITALTDNGLGVAGILDDCKIMSLKFYPIMLSSYASAAIVYAADNGADVISMSWGYPWPVQILQDALAYARQKGVVLVAAAGNDFIEFYNYPAAYEGIITVSASTRDDEIAEFSTFGNHIEVCAPGYGVLSLRADDFDMYAPGEPDVHVIEENYYLASGTSMACPHVAGVAAYLRAVSPGLTPDATQNILQTTADDIIDPYGSGGNFPGWDKYSGSGRVNLQAALAAAPDLRARITSPQPKSLVAGAVVISGFADGAEFAEYTLEVGVGGAPSTWTTLQTSTTPVTDGVLGEWNTSGLDGIYSIRLRVGDDNIASLLLFVTNSTLLEITAPQNGETVISWTEVIGSASCPDFDYSEIHYGAGAPPSYWYQIATLTTPVIAGPLTEWNAGALSDGIYSLRLSLYDDAGLVAADTVTIELQSPFAGDNGWRFDLNSDVTVVPNYGDFDGDGAYEIAVGTESGLVWLNPDGTEKTSGMPVTPADDFRVPVAVGDLDDDDIDDWVAIGADNSNSTAQMFGFPSSAANFVVDVPFPYISTTESAYRTRPYLFLNDIDGDGRDEIHYTQGHTHPPDGLARYRIYNADGSHRLDVPLLADFPHSYLPADLDGNGTAELYQARDQLYQYDLSGNLLQTIDFPNIGQGSFEARSLSAADLNGDGTLVLVVFGMGLADYGEYWTLLYDENLNLVSEGTHNNKIDNYLDPSPPVWGDIDGDGSLEYFVHIYELSQSAIYGYRADGSSYSGDTLLPFFAAPSDPAILYGGVIADVNGDRLPDVLGCVHPDVFQTYPVERLEAWDLNGQRLSGWPLVTVPNTLGHGALSLAHPVVGDLDRNGVTDVILCTVANELVFANISGAGYVFWAMPAPMFRYNRRMDNIYRALVAEEYLCGDADSDNLVNISDAVYVIAYIFAGGPAPWPLPAGDWPLPAGDTNCDGTVNITDAVYLTNYIFSGGPAPCDPDGDGIPDC
jgi:subtilisin family serine protease